MRFGEKLAILRDRSGMSQERLARGLKRLYHGSGRGGEKEGISQGYISTIERDTKKHTEVVVKGNKKKGIKEEKKVIWIPKGEKDDAVNIFLAAAICEFLRVPLDWMIDTSEGMLDADELESRHMLNKFVKEMGPSKVLRRLATGDVIQAVSPSDHVLGLQPPESRPARLPREKVSKKPPTQ